MDLFTYYREGRLKIAIDRVLPLGEAKTAHETIEARLTKGKLLLAMP